MLRKIAGDSLKLVGLLKKHEIIIDYTDAKGPMAAIDRFKLNSSAGNFKVRDEASEMN